MFVYFALPSMLAWGSLSKNCWKMIPPTHQELRLSPLLRFYSHITTFWSSSQSGHAILLIPYPPRWWWQRPAIFFVVISVPAPSPSLTWSDPQTAAWFSAQSQWSLTSYQETVALVPCPDGAKWAIIIMIRQRSAEMICRESACFAWAACSRMARV